MRHIEHYQMRQVIATWRSYLCKHSSLLYYSKYLFILFGRLPFLLLNSRTSFLILGKDDADRIKKAECLCVMVLKIGVMMHIMLPRLACLLFQCHVSSFQHHGIHLAAKAGLPHFWHYYYSFGCHDTCLATQSGFLVPLTP